MPLYRLIRTLFIIVVFSVPISIYSQEIPLVEYGDNSHGAINPVSKIISKGTEDRNHVNDTIPVNNGSSVDFNIFDNDIIPEGMILNTNLIKPSELKGIIEDLGEGNFIYQSLDDNKCYEESIVCEICDENNDCEESVIHFVITLPDSDGDNIPDYIEREFYNTDGDDYPDYGDKDSDGDGIPDLIEGGIIDPCNFDPTTYPLDTDGDGVPDYRSLDSDGDKIPDAIEGIEDCDGDGIPNYKDFYDDCADRLQAVELFSPNGDGVNDFFTIKGLGGFNTNELFIYNRWGGLVYNMKDYDNTWIGRSSGSAVGNDELPEGSYFFVLKLSHNQVLKGTVFIKR